MKKKSMRVSVGARARARVRVYEWAESAMYINHARARPDFGRAPILRRLRDYLARGRDFCLSRVYNERTRWRWNDGVPSNRGDSHTH